MFDFHTHTTFSDGVLSPDKLIKIASKRKVKVISVTDHDTISNYSEVKKACEEYNLELIKGIEISSTLDKKDTHILAYFQNEEGYFKLSKIEKINKEKRVIRLYKICENLKEEGVEISPEEILAVSDKGTIARPQIAAEIVKKGYAKNVQEAFQLYLYDGSKSYIPAAGLSTFEVLNMVKEYGGMSSLAHPTERFMDKEDLIVELVENGLQGIEVHHPSHDLRKRNHYTNWCRRYNLVVTGGSDYHGIKGKEDNLGTTKLPEAEYQRFKQRLYECSLKAL